MSAPAIVDGWETVDAPPAGATSPEPPPAPAPVHDPQEPDADGFVLDGPAPATADEQAQQAADAREAAEQAASEKPADEKDEKAEPEKKANKHPLSERVKQMRQRLDQTRRQVAEAAAERDRIQAEVAALAAKRQGADGEPAPDLPKPKWAEFDAAGKTWDEYQDAKDAWDAQQLDRRMEARKREELAAAERAHAERRTRANLEVVAARIDAAREAHDDFDDVITALDDIPQEKYPFLRDAIKLHEHGGEIMYFLAKHADTVARPLVALHEQGALTYPMMDALRETSRPTEFLGYLAAHPSEAERIAQLSPPAALVALGRIVARLEDAPAGSSFPARPTTKAVPPPAARVDGSRRVAGTSRDAEDGIAWDMS